LFPIILSKVIYDGSHCGEFLSVEQVWAVEREIQSLSGFHCIDPNEEKMIRSFEAQMRDLIAASLAVGKPIVF
jgi:hypothetical protein